MSENFPSWWMQDYPEAVEMTTFINSETEELEWKDEDIVRGSLPPPPSEFEFLTPEERRARLQKSVDNDPLNQEILQRIWRASSRDPATRAVLTTTQKRRKLLRPSSLPWTSTTVRETASLKQITTGDCTDLAWLTGSSSWGNTDSVASSSSKSSQPICFVPPSILSGVACIVTTGKTVEDELWSFQTIARRFLVQAKFENGNVGQTCAINQLSPN